MVSWKLPPVWSNEPGNGLAVPLQGQYEPRDIVSTGPAMFETHMHRTLSIIQVIHAPSLATTPKVASAQQSTKAKSEIPIEDRSMEIFG